MAVHVSFTVPANSQQAPLTNRNIIIGITFRDDDGDLIDVTGLTFIDLKIGSPNVRAETLTRQSIGFWHLGILLPENQNLTAFEVIMGSNAVSYESQTNEDIVGTGFIWFDTSGSPSPTPTPTPSPTPTPTPVNITFGEIDYRENGIIAVPIICAEAVVAVKTVFKITRASGDALGISYVLLGSGRDYELVFTVPPDRNGVFQIAAVGDVLKTGTGVWDNVTATPLDVPYGTVVPRIVDYEIPASYALGSPVDIFIAYNVEVTGWNANNPIDNPGIFEMEGAHLGTPSAYKWVGDSRPNFETLSKSMPNLRIEDTGQYDADKNNEALLALGWQPLKPPPPGDPTPGMNGYDNSTPPIWHGESGQYYLIRFSDPQEVGIFNLRERVGIVRGPVR